MLLVTYIIQINYLNRWYLFMCIFQTLFEKCPFCIQEKKATFYSDPTKAEQPANGHQSNGHQATGSVEKRPYEHEKAAKGIESTDQRDATIVGLGFNNPNYGVAANKDESST